LNLEDFNNIDLQNAGNAPLPVKAFLLSVLFVLIFALGYYLMWMPAFESLENEKAKESSLKQVFLSKKRQAINLDMYKQQMVEIETAFGALLKQLPDRSQIDGLLTDINQAGLERGLEFELFKPSEQIISEFYAEMPIAIKVIGQYKDLGAFATNVSKLSRIVTLDNISITKRSKSNGKLNLSEDYLVMDATARTYRYLDAGETQTVRDANEKKGGA
jgi:type IV pilus assembly protein PilO